MPDLLEAMLTAIGQHASASGSSSHVRIVFIGDIVDRGPSSREALYRLREAQDRMPEIVTILGNHEEMLLRALKGDEFSLRGWMQVGGAETVRSFGLEPLGEDDDAVPWLEELQRAIPTELVDWISDWPLTARSGDYFFCHAGIRPGIPLKRQVRRDLLWSRDEFLNDARDHGAVIVHGHTICENIELMSNRIGVDTGAYRSGRLSAVCLDGESVEILTVGDGKPLTVAIEEESLSQEPN